MAAAREWGVPPWEIWPGDSPTVWMLRWINWRAESTPHGAPPVMSEADVVDALNELGL